MVSRVNSPPSPPEPSQAPAEPALPPTSRYGLALFAVYLVLYAGFVLASAFAPALMEAELWDGVNVAVGWGIGLIVAALALALLYSALCRFRPEGETPTGAARSFPSQGATNDP